MSCLNDRQNVGLRLDKFWFFPVGLLFLKMESYSTWNLLISRSVFEYEYWTFLSSLNYIIIIFWVDYVYCFDCYLYV